MTTHKDTAGIIERLEAALKTAREIIANDLESEIYSHSIGGWDGKSKYTLSIEGEHYVRPIKKALKKIDAASAESILDGEDVAMNSDIALKAITQALTESSGQGTDGAKAMREAAAWVCDVEVKKWSEAKEKLRPIEEVPDAHDRFFNYIENAKRLASVIRALPLPVSADGGAK